MSTTEERLAEARVVSRASGRVVMSVRCPFCDVTVEAYLWSLAGSGKRCECGAVHHAKSATWVYTTK